MRKEKYFAIKRSLTNTHKETSSLAYLTFPDFSYPNIIL